MVALSPANARRSALLLFLGLAYALGPFTVDPFAPAFPKIGETFAASTALLQYSLAGVTLGMGLGTLLAGPFSDSIGRKRPMLVAIALYGIGAFGSSLAPDIWWFIGARAIMALGASGAAVLAAAIIRDLATGDAMLKLLARVMLIQGAAPVFGPILGSQLIQVISWRSLFQIFGVLAVVTLLLGALSFKETLSTDDRRGSAFQGMGKRFGYVLRDRSYQGLLVVSLVTTVQVYAYLNIFPFLALGKFGVSQNVYGLLAASVSLAWLISFQFGAFVAPRIGYVRTLVGSLSVGVLAGIGGLTIGASASSLPLVMVLIYMSIFAFGVSMGPVQTLSLAPHGEEAGTAAALMGTLNYLVTTLLAPVYTMLPTNSFSGLGGVYLVAWGLGLASVLLIVRPALARARTAL